MASVFAKPPVIEALCELRFASSQERPWDHVVPGLLYSAIQSRFPRRRDRPVVDLSPRGLSPRTFVQLLTEDEQRFVQVAPDLLAVNSLPPHVGWPALRDMLLEVLEAYRAVAAPAAIMSAAIRYINRVEIPLASDLTLATYFTTLPPLPAGVSEPVAEFQLRTAVAYDEVPRARLSFSFASAPSPPEVASFLLDYEHASAGPDAPTFDTLAAWLDEGHTRIERAFHGSVTQVTRRDIFKEVAA